MKSKETYSFIENGQKHMQCKSCYDYKPVDDKIVSFTCSKCTIIRTLKRTPLDEMIPSLKKKKLTADEKLYKDLATWKKRKKARKKK